MPDTDQLATGEHTQGADAPTDPRPISRRGVLRLAGLGSLGLLGVALSACGPSAAPASPTAAAKPTTAPAAATAVPAAATTVPAAPTTAPATGGSSAAWDALVADAKKEGKVVVSGPPSDDVRRELPAAFKQRFGIELEYIGGNSSQLASRIQSERTANQYTIDASLSGTDTMYGTFLQNKWLDPLKPALILPDVVDPSVWPTGGPWFRDPGGDTIIQLLNNSTPLGYVNTDAIQISDIKSADDLLNPKWKGKLAAYSPAVNGSGLVAGSLFYVSKGEGFAEQLYKGQQITLTRDYQQLGDWVAHASYPIGIAASYEYVSPYADVAKIEPFVLSDVHASVSGGFGMLGIWNQAPHPAAAKVFANWIASKEGISIYAKANASVPVRTDVDASSWVSPDLIPKKGVEYVDTYSYEFVTQTRQKAAKFYATLLG